METAHQSENVEQMKMEKTKNKNQIRETFKVINLLKQRVLLFILTKTEAVHLFPDI